MTYRYVVFGAGTQGPAAAFDLAQFGDASEVILVDNDKVKAKRAAKRVNKLLGSAVVKSHVMDMTDKRALTKLLANVDAGVSAVSYRLNEEISKTAIETRTHLCDLGGNTAIVRKQRKLNKKAVKAKVTIVPDCGMGPGFNLSLAHSALREMTEPEHCTIYCGGLPQVPEGELKYALCFSMDGLVNEYSGEADVLLGGQLAKEPCLGGVEKILPPYLFHTGELEAAYTSGGLSTAPWTYQEMFPSLQSLVYKTLRYPGHWDHVRAFRDEGCLRERLEAHLGVSPQEFSDLGIIIVRCTGKNARGGMATVSRSVIDRYDLRTGFTAMQRLTGFHASIVAIAAVKGLIPYGVLPIELVDGDMIIAEMKKRSIFVGQTYSS